MLQKDPVVLYSDALLSTFEGLEEHGEVRTYDATRGRGGAAQGNAGADVFGRAIAIVRRRIYNTARAEVSKVAELTVPPREAKAFGVSAGHFFRIVSVEGPQVGDLNLWNAHDLTERFYSGKTRALHATHLSTGDRLWSTFPRLRPMATITHDTLDWYGWDRISWRPNPQIYDALRARSRHILAPAH